MTEGKHWFHFRPPSNATKRFVRFYAHRESRLGSSLLVHPVPARSEHVLDFEFGDVIQIHSFRDGSVRDAETPALIGLQSHRRVEQLIQGHVESFSIFFRPTALNLLFGLPAVCVTNADYDAGEVLGRSVARLWQRLADCNSFPQRVRVAEDYLIPLASNAPLVDPIELTANGIVRNCGICRINTLAHGAGLSSRTFHRRFKHAVGLSPKLFARIVRFQSALQEKAASPHSTWTDIVMHLIVSGS